MEVKARALGLVHHQNGLNLSLHARREAQPLAEVARQSCKLTSYILYHSIYA